MRTIGLGIQLWAQNTDWPSFLEAARLVDDLGYEDDGICHVTARYGFQDDIDIPGILRGALKQLEGDVNLENVSYFISRASISITDDPCMARWRKKLFAAIARNAANPVGYFNLPDERTVVMGAHVEL